MLTQLSTVKSRLALTVTDYDDLLTSAIKAVSDRFDRECNRTLARTTAATHEFDANDTEILPPCYPVEAVTKFELKTTEAEGWIEQTGTSYLLQQACTISLTLPLSFVPQVVTPQLARVTYTGGYVMPGMTPSTGQTVLPADLETAAIEQVAAWFQQRDKLGLIRYWPSGGTYLVLIQLPLLPQVSAMSRPSSGGAFKKKHEKRLE